MCLLIFYTIWKSPQKADCKFYLISTRVWWYSNHVFKHHHLFLSVSANAKCSNYNTKDTVNYLFFKNVIIYIILPLAFGPLRQPNFSMKFNFLPLIPKTRTQVKCLSWGRDFENINQTMKLTVGVIVAPWITVLQLA